MNNMKPAWYRTAKQGSDRPLVFTEEMKQAVRRRIEGGERRTGWKKRAAAVAALLVFVSAAAWIAGRSETDGKEAAGTKSAGTEAIFPREEIALQYDTDKNTEYHQLRRMKLSSVTITDKREFEGIGTIYSYDTMDKDGIPHLALSFTKDLDTTPAGEIYDFGFGGIDSFKLTRSNLFGEDRVKLYSDQCAYGDCYYFADWIRFDDGQAAIDLHVDAPVYEVDLNGDGKTELVMSSQSYDNKVTVYRNTDDSVKSVDLSTTLGVSSPDSVVFDRENLVFHTITGDDVRSFRLSNDGQKLVRIETLPAAVKPLKRDTLVYTGYSYLKKKSAMDPDVFSGYRSALLEIGGYELFGQWTQDPALDFGLFLPNSAKAVKGKDGIYTYELMKGKGSIAFETGSLQVPIKYEDDLAILSNYAGTAVASEGADSRTDYFLIEHDADHRVYVALTYKLEDINKVRPILLAMMAGVKYAPEHPK